MTLQTPHSVLPRRRRTAPRRLRTVLPLSRQPARQQPGPIALSPRVPERGEGKAVPALRHVGADPSTPLAKRKRSSRFLHEDTTSALIGQ